MDLAAHIRDVPDFPKPGIVFKDICPLLRNPAALAAAIDGLALPFRDQGITAVAGIEARGFIFAPPVALALGCGFVPMRKPGKLPWQARRLEYQLEYGSDSLEIHADAVGPGDRVLVVDDVLATGGTAAAAAQLIELCGATVVACAFVVDLAFLGGGTRLGRTVHALLRYD